jgi:hypothetical protein
MCSLYVGNDLAPKRAARAAANGDEAIQSPSERSLNPLDMQPQFECNPL